MDSTATTATTSELQLPSYNIFKAPNILETVELEACCRSAKWCTDGRAILAVNEDRVLDVYEFPNEENGHSVVSLQEPGRPQENPESPKSLNERKRSFRQGAPIYETLWYPYSSPLNPAMFCFVASVRDSPIKLLDASDGRLRASYKIEDHRERFVAPHSLAFNLTGQRLYCGFLDAIEVFDISTPGEGTRLRTIPSKKSKDGLRGIISTLAFCPDYSGLFAAGTFSSSIGLFSEETGNQVLMYLEGVPGPVTQLQFHSTNPNLLFTSARKRDDIFIWDVRKSTTILHRFNLPSSSSNQRRKFDIDVGGRWLVAGDEDGTVAYYDVATLETDEPLFKFKAHNDTISTTSFHPSKPILLTVSGSRRFLTPTTSESSLSSGSLSTAEAAEEGISDTREGRGVDTSDKSLSQKDYHRPQTQKKKGLVRTQESAITLWHL